MKKLMEKKIKIEIIIIMMTVNFHMIDIKYFILKMTPSLKNQKGKKHIKYMILMIIKVIKQYMKVKC